MDVRQRGERSGLDRYGLSAEPAADAQVGTITDPELGAVLASGPADANPPLSARPDSSAAGTGVEASEPIDACEGVAA